MNIPYEPAQSAAACDEGQKFIFYAAERQKTLSECDILWYSYSRYAIHFASFYVNKNKSAWDYFLFATATREQKKAHKSLNQWMCKRFFGRQTIKANLYSIRILPKTVYPGGVAAISIALLQIEGY